MKKMNLTKDLERRFAQLGSQDDKGDGAIVVAKFFTPDSQWTWFCIAFEPETRECFGLVQGFEVELDYFSLDEMEAAKGPLGLPIERDLTCSPKAGPNPRLLFRLLEAGKEGR